MAERRHRITVDEYYRMAEEGLFAPDAREELIEGEIVDMPPIGSRHAEAVRQLGKLLYAAVGDRAIVQCQLPIRLGNCSEPQPDFTVLVQREQEYGQRHPVAADVILAIEVSDTTLRFDLQTKVPMYARHGVRELWVIDLDGATLHRFRDPQGSVYAEVSSGEPGVVAVSLLPGTSVDISQLFRASIKPDDPI